MIAAFNESLLDYAGGREIEIAGGGAVTSGIKADGAPAFQPVNLRLFIGPKRRPPEPPLVSCLMPTKGRFEQAQLAIGCYRRQTWPNRELVVIDQNTDGRLAAWIAGLNDPSIRVFPMPALQEPLGVIRNMSIDLATGQLLCAWDDDDLHHAAYIEIAFAAMSAAKAAMCMLLRETLWIPSRQRVGVRHPRPHCNTILVRRDAGLRYVPRAHVEDTPAVEELLRRLPAILVDLPELYLYVVHSGNTSRPGFLDWVWQTSTDRTEGAATVSTMAQLARAFPMAEYASAIKPHERTRETAAAPDIPLLGHTADTDVVVTTQALMSGARNPGSAVPVKPAKLSFPIGPSWRKSAPPLISCLMPTKDRFEQARLAIGCFRRQTWPNRELIVLDQSRDDRLATWIATLDDPTIRMFAMPGLAEPLGAIRNRSMALAEGAMLCVWDDDDLHHPLRLEVSAAAIAATNASACMLMAETIWTPRMSRIAVLRRVNENTLLMLRDPDFSYPALPRGSDTIAVKEFLRRRQAVLVNLPELYIYVLHGRNTWDEKHTERLWSISTDKAEGAAAEHMLSRLAQAYPVAEYAAFLRREAPVAMTGEEMRPAAQR